MLRQKAAEQALREAAILHQDSQPNVELPPVDTSAFIDEFELPEEHDFLPAPDFHSLRYDSRGNEISFTLGGFVSQREIELTNERMRMMAEEFENSVGEDLFASAFEQLHLHDPEPDDDNPRATRPNVEDSRRKKEEQKGWEPYPNKTVRNKL